MSHLFSEVTGGDMRHTNMEPHAPPVLPAMVAGAETTSAIKVQDKI